MDLNSPLQEEFLAHAKADFTFATPHNSWIPISTLPHEIFAKIFVACQPVRRDKFYGSGPPTEHTLSQVCQAWREIALDTAALWTQPEWPGRPKSINLYSFSRYLERSKEMSIDIVVSSIPSGMCYLIGPDATKLIN